MEGIKNNIDSNNKFMENPLPNTNTTKCTNTKIKDESTFANVILLIATLNKFKILILKYFILFIFLYVDSFKIFLNEIPLFNRLFLVNFLLNSFRIIPLKINSSIIGDTKI